jgi:hypothetical protein
MMKLRQKNLRRLPIRRRGRRLGRDPIAPRHGETAGWKMLETLAADPKRLLADLKSA